MAVPANGVFTIAKGRFGEKMSFPLGTDAILVVLLQTTGLVADTTLVNYTTLAAILSGGSTEATFTNYARKVVSSGITLTPNTTAYTMTAALANLTWTAAGGVLNNSLGKMITAYRPTSSTLDAQCLPLTYHAFTATTTGADLLASIASTGLALAS